MATLFGRKTKTTEPTHDEMVKEQAATDTLRERLDALRPRVRELEAEHEAIETELSDILLANLMGQKPAVGQIDELYTRREANQRELEESRAILDRAEAQLTAMIDQENARLAAITRVKLQAIGEEIKVLEAEYATRFADLGDFLDAFFAKRADYDATYREFFRHSPNRGPEGVHQPRPDLFHMPENYSAYGRRIGTSLREQVDAWARQPEERAAHIRREAEIHAKRSAELNELEERERQRAERYAAQAPTMRYP